MVSSPWQEVSSFYLTGQNEGSNQLFSKGGSVFTCNYQNLAGFKLCCAKNIVQGEPLINQIWSLYQSQTGPFCTLLVIFAIVSQRVKNHIRLFTRPSAIHPVSPAP